ncbi:MAG: S41 family peptidase [Actinocatenispora sp.]
MEEAEIIRIVDETSDLVRARYVFPEIGERIAVLLDTRRADGRYTAADSPATLAALVTEDLQSVNGDKHLRLKYHPERIPDQPGEEAVLAMLARDSARDLGGIGRIERLDGNVALLEFSPVLYPPEMTGEDVCAAMRLAARGDALVIDLRQCRGGTPSTVALICGHLVEESTHLMSFFERHPDGDRTTQSWTPPYVAGRRLAPTAPVYVLTSATTFSGGEELAYDLQQLGRATVVGERTGGGAHPRAGFRLHPHLEATVPVGRSIHPVTGTNWEGVGVVPDLEVPAGEALRVAHRLALTALADRSDAPAVA